MAFLFNYRIKNVPIDHIDLNNDDFKISKSYIDEKLEHSILSHGLIDPPVLFKDKDSYIIIYGHNRLSILKRQMIDSVSSIVVDTIDPSAYMEYAILKNYRGEISPIGKIKFIRILKEKFELNTKDISFSARCMKIPDDILHNNEPWRKFQFLPKPLKDYINSKDISFKIIKNILLLPEEAISLISTWVMDNMRINIFKGIIDLIIDINKRDKGITKLKKIELSSIDDRRKREESLYKEIFKIRYPEYANIKSKAKSIINNFKANGLEIDFPEYFESDEIGILFKVNKRDGMESFKDKLNNIDMDLVKDLLDLL